jgi:HK97 family phage major capsid protein
MNDFMDEQAASNALAIAFEHYKQANDERLSAIERKGSADPLIDDKLRKQDADINRLQTTITQLKTAAARPATPTGTSWREGDKTAEQKRFLKYVKSGLIEDDAEYKSMSVSHDVDGGFAVTAEVAEGILRRQYDATPMRQVANVLSITSDAIELLRDATDAVATWVAETDTRAETDAGQFGRIRISVNELHAQPQVTQKLLDDANLNIEEYIINKIADRFSRRENAAFFSGTGVNQPRGIASYTTAATADDTRAWGVFEHVGTGTSGAFAASNPGDALISLMYKLRPGYMNGAAWMMPRAVADDIRKFKDSTGQYLWQPGLNGGQLATLLGFPVYLCEDMPAKAANSLSVAFGNFKEGYTIVDRLGLRIFRDPYTAAPFVKFRCSKRVGGDVTNFDAIKFIRMA